MSERTMANLDEKKESLWRVIVSPTIWAAHFLLSYVTAAIWCAKFVPRDGSADPVRWAIVIYTAVALSGIAINGWGGWRRQRMGGSAPLTDPAPHDDDTPLDRTRFLGFSTLLLAGLSGIATIYAALVVLFFGSCR
jgi:hypothetical protein